MIRISDENKLFYSRIEKKCKDMEEDLEKMKKRLYSVGHKLDSLEIYFEEFDGISREINEKMDYI